jgi:hypothetical protein
VSPRPTVPTRRLVRFAVALAAGLAVLSGGHQAGASVQGREGSSQTAPETTTYECKWLSTRYERIEPFRNGERTFRLVVPADSPAKWRHVVERRREFHTEDGSSNGAAGHSECTPVAASGDTALPEGASPDPTSMILLDCYVDRGGQADWTGRGNAHFTLPVPVTAPEWFLDHLLSGDEHDENVPEYLRRCIVLEEAAIEQWGHIFTRPAETPSLDARPPEFAVPCKDKRTLVDDGRNWEDQWRAVVVPVTLDRQWIETIMAGSEGCDLAAQMRDSVGGTCEELGGPYESRSMPPDECWGTYPTAHYKITWKGEDPLDDILGWLASFMFDIGKLAVQLALWLVSQAFGFDLNAFNKAGANLAGRYKFGLVDEWLIDRVIWFALFAWAAFTAVRGRLNVAAGEILLSIVLASIALAAFNARVDYIDLIDRVLRVASSDLLSVASGGSAADNTDDGVDPAGAIRAVRPVQRTIHETFVEEAYFLVSYGTVPEGACRERANEVLEHGVDGDWTVDHLRRRGCPELADANAKADGTKVLNAFLVMVVNVFLLVLLGLSAVTMLVGKVLIAFLFAVFPFVAPFATAPGRARRVLWSWLAYLGQAAIAVLCVAVFLCFQLTITTEALKATQGKDVAYRWLAVYIGLVVLYYARKHLVARTSQWAGSWADSLTRASPAAAGWAGIGPGGLDLSRTDRGFRNMAVAGGVVASLGATYAANRMRDRRAARFSLNNLEYMARRVSDEPQVRYRVPGGGGGGGGGRSGSFLGRLEVERTMTTRRPRPFLAGNGMLPMRVLYSVTHPLSAHRHLVQAVADRSLLSRNVAAMRSESRRQWVRSRTSRFWR